MRTRSKYWPIVLCLFVLSSVAVWAAGNGSWTGTLRDANGDPVKRAKIQLRAADRTLEGESLSSDAGKFVVSDIAAGSYRVVIEIGEKNWRSDSVLTVRDG